MTFTTLTFVIFLAIVFGLYWTIGSLTLQNALLAIASCVFYGWWDWRFCALMIMSALIDWALGMAVHTTGNRRLRKGLVFASCAANLLVLGFFKYFNFFQENFIAVANQFGWRTDPLTLNIILPVGISFYTFQSMSYIIDIYRNDILPTRSPIAYLAYVSFFPQLVAGPIERASNLLPQFCRKRSFSRPAAIDGCRQMLWGFAKKMIVADNLAPFVDAAFGEPSGYCGLTLAFAIICFAFQIYCDFSAYSDIALGTARLFGFRLMRNFAYPYFSQDLVEFWRRWHISLSTWFRDYVYLPLGGNRAGKWIASRNVFVTFLLSGLWHGASWNFVIWGAMHGIAVVITSWIHGRAGVTSLRTSDTPGGQRFLPPIASMARMAGTFAFVCLGWVFFRAASTSESWAILGPIVTRPLTLAGGASVTPLDIAPAMLLLYIFGIVSVEWLQRDKAHPLAVGKLAKPVRWLVYTLLFWLTLGLQSGESTSFIYFQF